MPFRASGDLLRDIVSSIELIQEFTAGMDEDIFRKDPRTLAAVERILLKISEAAYRLGDDAERICHGPPWRDIRGIGNWLRHQYDDVDSGAVWRTVENDLPSLKEAVLKAIVRL